ncbi:MAG TPA: SCO family protein [Pseudogracilibacillus sp.]|nr:SCO family protein [Pseudogracilibacillus sp.]
MTIRTIIYSLVCLLVLSSCSTDQARVQVVTDFSFTDQNEQPFGTDDLQGKVWIATFIFSNCETVCPPMMAEMASLQREIESRNLTAEFVIFTVDPENDRPEVLKDFLQQFTADERNWHMLTGYTQEEIESFAISQFQTIVQKPEDSNQVIHGTNFYLVDDKGYIINEYNYSDESYVEEIVEEIYRMSK